MCILLQNREIRRVLFDVHDQNLEQQSVFLNPIHVVYLSDKSPCSITDKQEKHLTVCLSDNLNSANLFRVKCQTIHNFTQNHSCSVT